MSIPRFNISTLKQSIKRQQSELKKSIFRSVAMDIWASEKASPEDKLKKKFNLKEGETVLVFRYELTREDRKILMGDIPDLENDIENKEKYERNESWYANDIRSWNYLFWLYLTGSLYVYRPSSDSENLDRFILEFLKYEFRIAIKIVKLTEASGIVALKYKLPSVSDLIQSEHNKEISDESTLLKYLASNLNVSEEHYVENVIKNDIQNIIGGFKNVRLNTFVEELEEDRQEERIADGINFTLVDTVRLL
jgi:hypothetical protein